MGLAEQFDTHFEEVHEEDYSSDHESDQDGHNTPSITVLFLMLFLIGPLVYMIVGCCMMATHFCRRRRTDSRLEGSPGEEEKFKIVTKVVKPCCDVCAAEVAHSATGTTETIETEESQIVEQAGIKSNQEGKQFHDRTIQGKDVYGSTKKDADADADADDAMVVKRDSTLLKRDENEETEEISDPTHEAASPALDQKEEIEKEDESCFQSDISAPKPEQKDDNNEVEMKAGEPDITITDSASRLVTTTNNSLDPEIGLESTAKNTVPIEILASEDDTNVTCQICFEEMNQGQEVSWSYNKNCCHVFHNTCIESWRIKSGSLNCPSCRQEFFMPDRGDDDDDDGTLSKANAEFYSCHGIETKLDV